MRLALFVLFCAHPLLAEEIRIEIAHGRQSLKVNGRVLSAADVPAHFRQPLAVDGQELPGTLDVFAGANGALEAVNALDLEDYVAAVVASEVPASWPLDALRAQAVAARTFAVAQKIAQGPAARAHLGASVLDQVYKATAHPAAAAARAAHDTAGEVLTFGAAPIAAYFSASCGGVSETAEAAFHVASGTTPYLHGSDHDEDEHGWTVKIPVAELDHALRKRIGAEARGLAVLRRTASGRADALSVATARGNRPLPAVELRQLLGYQRLPSLLFEVEMSDGAAVFRGRGSGHGVGLCQWGARGRAMEGEGYREILAHYYPGAEIRRMY
ncbi:MAG TPA: SpoIID/LytB domain-containing protein [Myxococcales bacterium]|jgi:stage II sporulation protein D